MPPVRLELATPISLVKHSIAEPPRSIISCVNMHIQLPILSYISSSKTQVSACVRVCVLLHQHAYVHFVHCEIFDVKHLNTTPRCNSVIYYIKSNKIQKICCISLVKT